MVFFKPRKKRGGLFTLCDNDLSLSSPLLLQWHQSKKSADYMEMYKAQNSGADFSPYKHTPFISFFILDVCKHLKDKIIPVLIL